MLYHDVLGYAVPVPSHLGSNHTFGLLIVLILSLSSLVLMLFSYFSYSPFRVTTLL